jgi:hypothetical protein
MENKHRKNLGISESEDEEYVITKPTEDGSHCRLGLPAPALQSEVKRTKRPVKFYFAVHMMIPAVIDATTTTDYFICHGDQLAENVFIAAIHEDGASLPAAFLCVGAHEYMKWMFPTEGTKSEVPPAQAWTLYNPTEFCRANINHNLSDDTSSQLTIHIVNAALFEDKAVATIEQLALAKASGEYDFIFNYVFTSEEDEHEEPPPKKPRAKTPLPPPREKLPRGGLLVKPGTIDVNALADAATKQADVAEQQKNKRTKKGKESTVTAANPPKKGKTPCLKSVDDPPTKTRAKTTPMVSQQGASSSTLEPLVSALTAVVNKLASPVVTSTSTIVPPIPTCLPPTRAELREESKYDHILRHEMKMDELKYIREMKSIFTDEPSVRQQASNLTTTVTTVNTTSGTIDPPQSQTNINEDVALKEAWRILTNADSWKDPKEKDAVLKDEVGAYSATDLPFLEPVHLKMLVSKLKLVQANRLKAALKLND